MKPKIISFIVIGILLLISLWLLNREDTNRADANPLPQRESRGRKAPARSGGTAERGFIRKVSYLEFTVHAKCRMKCRRITQEEVKDIMRNGKINYSKSDLDDRPCPTYALEGYTMQDQQHVRIVFAQCAQKTKVVTCIDLDKDFTCHCK